jgi:pimeloyl-ACP methyl ester carboxylesterase
MKPHFEDQLPLMAQKKLLPVEKRESLGGKTFWCLGWSLQLVLIVAHSASAAPCTSVRAACSEWVTIGQAAGRPSRTFIYRSHSLETRNEEITRALIVVHGAGRDAGNYFRHVLAAAFLANSLENAVVVAPRFASNNGGGCLDKLENDELNWTCAGPERWTAGGRATNNRQVTSFEMADEILRKLARKEIFPNLTTIVVAGHSAGGQFVTRYQMANQVHDRLGVEIAYVVSNPSSYAYPDSLRPNPKPPPPFVPFSDAVSCPTFDAWPYGLQNRKGYTASFSDEQLKKQMVARPTTYLLGGLDILPLFGFDGSCSAMAQGPTRLARGLAFSRYLNEEYGAEHGILIVPSCGHNARCMFTADPALPLLFPK